MSATRRVVEEYTALLARAFNGAIEVDGTRIVAHPSGTLVARGGRKAETAWQPPISDRDTDWSDV